jgi:hypothetical protein
LLLTGAKVDAWLAIAVLFSIALLLVSFVAVLFEAVMFVAQSVEFESVLLPVGHTPVVLSDTVVFKLSSVA